jgi:hypothetical protein
MSKTATASLGRTLAESESGFGLVSLTGPALVAGDPVSVGDQLTHSEYGLLEVRGYGKTNGALGAFLKLTPVNGDEQTTSEIPRKWSLDSGGQNSLADAFAADKIAVVDGE